MGEDIAAKFLEKNSCRILFRNLRWKLGELDIVARDLAGVLLFVEVKTLTGEGSNPEQNFTHFKAYKTHRAAELFLQTHPGVLRGSGLRIDLIAIKLRFNDGESLAHPDALRWYKNVA